MRVGFNSGTSGQSIGLDSVRLSRPRVVLHRAEKCEENSCWNTLATVLSSRTITGRKEQKSEETGMTSRIEPHRVSAYNTSKHSENKMHDDTVAKRYGFVGGRGRGGGGMGDLRALPAA